MLKLKSKKNKGLKLRRYCHCRAIILLMASLRQALFELLKEYIFIHTKRYKYHLSKSFFFSFFCSPLDYKFENLSCGYLGSTRLVPAIALLTLIFSQFLSVFVFVFVLCLYLHPWLYLYLYLGLCLYLWK